MAFKLDPNYKGVPERLADLKAKYPEGSVQPVDPAKPYWFEEREGRTFVVYAAAAYRTPDDPRPGIGLAWERFPGTTPYTEDSELQNAETSAWGRAIVAALASESKSVSSAEDVRNQRARQPEEILPGRIWPKIANRLGQLLVEAGVSASAAEVAETWGLKGPMVEADLRVAVQRVLDGEAPPAADLEPVTEGLCDECGEHGLLESAGDGSDRLVCVDEPACFARVQARAGVPA